MNIEKLLHHYEVPQCPDVTIVSKEDFESVFSADFQSNLQEVSISQVEGGQMPLGPVPKDVVFKHDLLLLEREIAKALPDPFKGDSKVDAQYVESLRPYATSKIHQYDESVVTLANVFLAFVQNVQDKRTQPGCKLAFDVEFTARLVDEIQYLLRTKKMSYNSLLSAIGRFLYSINGHREDEMAFLKLVPQAENFEGGIKEKSWRNPAFFQMNKNDHVGGYKHHISSDKNNYWGFAPLVYGGIDYEGYYSYMREVLDGDTMLPNAFIYPVIGESALGTATLFKAYNRGVFLVGANDKAVNVHATRLGPAGFAIHDWAHGEEADPREKIMRHLLHKLSAKILNAGVEDMSEAVDVAMKYITKRHAVFQKVYELVYYRVLVTALLHYKDPAMIKRCLIGFFLQMHEHPKFKQDTYLSSDLESVFSDLYQGMLDDDLAVKKFDIDEVDPLKTNVNTGKSTLTDNQIKRHFLSKLSAEQRVKVKSIEITFEGYYYAAEIKLKTGKVIKETEFTLKYHYNDLNDKIRLLLYGGISFKRSEPVLNPDIKGQRCVDDMRRMNELVCGLVGETQEFIKSIINKQESVEDPRLSIKEQYAKDQAIHELELMRDILLAKEKDAQPSVEELMLEEELAEVEARKEKNDRLRIALTMSAAHPLQIHNLEQSLRLLNSLKLQDANADKSSEFFVQSILNDHIEFAQYLVDADVDRIILMNEEEASSEGEVGGSM